MQQKAKSFFLLLMVTFILGVLIHLVIPIQVVVNATQKIEQAYNGYKIQVEQNTVRSIAFLNSLAITNQIQIYENVRSTVIRLFETGNRYDETDLTKINMNNAYLLANSNVSVTAEQAQHTMWFISGVTQYTEMNQLQLWILSEFAQIEEYMGAFDITNEYHQGLQAIQITINFSGQQIYFEYPSSSKPEFLSLNASALRQDYNTTVLNYKTSKRYQTIINSGEQVKACSSILDNNEPFAVVCLKLDMKAVMGKITSVLKLPDFQLSSSRYYLLRPIYEFENQSFPGIMAYFSSDNLDKVYFPVQQYFKQMTQNLQSLFNSKQNYLLNIQQLSPTKTYYSIPIETYNNIDTKQIIMYLVVVNDFAKSNLKTASHYKQFFVIMLVPSTILLAISALAMGVIMRPLFAKLRYYSQLMNDYCHYIHKNDLNLQITQQGQTSDFLQLFKNIKWLNLLNKLSTPSYLKVSPNERIIKLLRALQLFDQLGYTGDHSKVNVYENLAYCYQRTGDTGNAVKYLEKSVESSVKELGGIQEIEGLIREDAESSRAERTKQSTKRKSSIRHIRYKIFKLCQILFQNYQAGDLTTYISLQKYIQILRRLLYRTSISIEYVYCYIRQSLCMFDNGTPKYILDERLEESSEMIRRIECSGSNKSSNLVPVEVLKSWRYLLKGRVLRTQGSYLEAYETFVLALDGLRFDPEVHKMIRKDIYEILDLCQIPREEVSGIFQYLGDQDEDEDQGDVGERNLMISMGMDKHDQDKQNSRAQKQWIFLSDVSNPNMNSRQFADWKGKARKMAQFIFENYIHSKDRIGISQFCHDMKVICNLIEKGTSETMLKKELMGSIKARDQTIYSQLVPNLKKVIDRTKNLKKDKIYITFLKEGIQIDSADILDIIQSSKGCENSMFIFVVEEGSCRFNIVEEGFYIVDFGGYENLEIILGEKCVKRADNIVYLF